jgi:TonB family protein
MSSSANATPPSPRASTGDEPARPGPRTSADPAPKGTSELDPVSVVGTMDFRSGSTTVRAGRKHKLVRPRLTLDAKLDLATLGSTYVVLGMRLDAAGNVVNSEVVRSSGSGSLDQIVKVTSYEWWFEPARDASNQPAADAFQFVIRIN